MATTDDPIEVIKALIGNKWDKEIKFRKLLPKVYGHWIDQADLMPAINVWKVFSPVSTRHLAGNHLMKFERMKVIMRSKDFQDLHKMEEEIERIIVENNIFPTTPKFTNSGIGFMRLTNTFDLVDGTFHRRDMDLELYKQRVY